VLRRNARGGEIAWRAAVRPGAFAFELQRPLERAQRGVHGGADGLEVHLILAERRDGRPRSNGPGSTRHARRFATPALPSASRISIQPAPDHKLPCASARRSLPSLAHAKRASISVAGASAINAAANLVASGEASGKLEQMLERAARLETQALERRLVVFLTLLEPVMILLMGGVVLMIVLAILLPIIEINQLVR